MVDHGPARVRLAFRIARAPWRTLGGIGPLLLSAGSVGLVVALVVAAEMGAQARSPDYLRRTRGTHVFSDVYGWRSRKGSTLLVDGRRVSFNARGFRGRDLAVPRVDGRMRVAVLGDSIAFGLQVSDEDTFTQTLDARDNGIEAANLAVQGYGPGQELLVLMDEGLRLDPDVVILAFCLGNDFADSVLEVSLYDGRTSKPRFRLVDGRLLLDDANLQRSATQRVGQWLADHSHLLNRVASLGSRIEPPVALHWRARKREALRDEGYALRLNLALVRRMDALCRARGITFVLAAFPNASSWHVKSWLAETFLQSLQGEGVTVVDMSARFRARGLAFADVALDGVGHLNRLGHSVAGQILESEIAARRQKTFLVSDKPGPRSPQNDAGGR